MSIQERTNQIGHLFEGDKIIWLILFLLSAVSLLEVYSATSNIPNNSGAYWSPVLTHAVFLTMGIGVTWVIHRIQSRYFGALVVIGPVVSISLLVAVMFFAGEVNDTQRWLRIPHIGLTIQPSELAKGTLVVVVAYLLGAMRDERGATRKAFWLILAFTAVICAFIVTENLSTAVIAFAVVMIMMFIGDVPWREYGTLIGAMAIAGTMSVATLYLLSEQQLQSFKGTKLERISTWAHRLHNHTPIPDDPNDYDLNTNPQITQARIAIATCNVVGRMPGNSRVRDFLPHAYSDYIYAIIIEEMGLAGSFFVMLFYIVLLYRAARAAQRSTRYFQAYLMMGLALLIVTQALINMAVAVDLFPVTGQPLPIVSKGGTSIMVNCAYIGMMLSITRDVAADDTQAPA